MLNIKPRNLRGFLLFGTSLQPAETIYPSSYDNVLRLAGVETDVLMCSYLPRLRGFFYGDSIKDSVPSARLFGAVGCGGLLQ